MAATILIIDDSRAICSALERHCRDLGYDTLSVNSGEDGLRVLYEKEIDIVITDIVMPGMSGEDVICQIKQTPSLAAIPILVISSLSSQDIVVRCIELGAEDLLPKPFVPAILYARLNTCLEKARLRKMEIRMHEDKGAEKCSHEMVGAICHNFNQPITAGMCSIKVFERLLDILVRLLRHVRDNMGEDSFKKCEKIAEEFVAGITRSLSLDEILDEIGNAGEDVRNSFARIEDLVKSINSFVRPASVDYMSDVSIIDFDESRRKMVLVAAENEKSLSCYIDRISGMGYHVISAGNVRDAAMQARFCSPDLLVVELEESGSDSFLDIFKLKSMGEFDVPLMVVSESGSACIAPALKEYSNVINKYVSKSVLKNTDMFRERIEDLLGQGVESGK